VLCYLGETQRCMDKFNAGGNPAMDSIRGRRNTHLVASCFRNWDNLRLDRPIGSYIDRFLLPSLIF